MTRQTTTFSPPRPAELPAVAALARAVWRGDGDLLDLLPAAAYREPAPRLGYSRRGIRLFNDPAMVREILLNADGAFPKSDLMVGALEPLIGNSIFTSDGEVWARQRAMIDPAFSALRLSVAFDAMSAACDAFEERTRAQAGETVSLDLMMSHLTADIICRTVFSTPLSEDVTRDVFDDFAIFERDVAQVRIGALIVAPAFAPQRQPQAVAEACARIRRHLGVLVDSHLEAPERWDDIASAVIAARDAETGRPFTREELIDQLGVFFLAGHETSASALTWAVFVMATRPDILTAARAEVASVAGDGPITFQQTKRMPFLRSLFRETLRLYPPITFMPRVAMRDTRVGGVRVPRGTLVMIAPWTIHRHRGHWRRPNVFDAERFLAGEGEERPGTYLPFGLGPHTCIGAGFASVEAVLILARLARAFDWQVEDAHKVRPAARLTTRPARQVHCRITTR